MSKRFVGQVVMLGALAGAVACTQEPDRAPVEVDVERPGARDDVNEAAEEAEEAARESADAVSGAADKVGNAVSGAVQTADIKAALAADDLVEANDIDVDTNGTTKVVTLKGRVPSAAAKARAEAVAKREADGYRIDNQLVVRAS